MICSVVTEFRLDNLFYLGALPENVSGGKAPVPLSPRHWLWLQSAVVIILLDSSPSKKLKKSKCCLGLDRYWWWKLPLKISRKRLKSMNLTSVGKYSSKSLKPIHFRDSQKVGIPKISLWNFLLQKFKVFIFVFFFEDFFNFFKELKIKEIITKNCKVTFILE